MFVGEKICFAHGSCKKGKTLVDVEGGIEEGAERLQTTFYVYFINSTQYLSPARSP